MRSVAGSTGLRRQDLLLGRPAWRQVAQHMPAPVEDDEKAPIHASRPACLQHKRTPQVSEKQDRHGITHHNHISKTYS